MLFRVQKSQKILTIRKSSFYFSTFWYLKFASFDGISHISWSNLLKTWPLSVSQIGPSRKMTTYVHRVYATLLHAYLSLNVKASAYRSELECVSQLRDTHERLNRRTSDSCVFLNASRDFGCTPRIPKHSNNPTARYTSHRQESKLHSQTNIAPQINCENIRKCQAHS